MTTKLDLYTHHNRMTVYCLLFDAAMLTGTLRLHQYKDSFPLVASAWYTKVTNETHIPHEVLEHVTHQMTLLYNEGLTRWDFMSAIPRFIKNVECGDASDYQASNATLNDPPEMMMFQVYQLYLYTYHYFSDSYSFEKLQKWTIMIYLCDKGYPNPTNELVNLLIDQLKEFHNSMVSKCDWFGEDMKRWLHEIGIEYHLQEVVDEELEEVEEQRREARREARQREREANRNNEEGVEEGSDDGSDDNSVEASDDDASASSNDGDDEDDDDEDDGSISVFSTIEDNYYIMQLEEYEINNDAER